jgi:hypothetical protein
MAWPFSYDGPYSPAKTRFYVWSRRILAAASVAAIIYGVYLVEVGRVRG